MQLHLKYLSVVILLNALVIHGCNQFAINKTCLIANNAEKIPFKHFWKSTGLSPPDLKMAHKFLLSSDEKFNLIFIASLPHEGIQQVRIHWLLNLITFNKSNKSLNFTNLDLFLDFLSENQLNPGFELMGFPLNLNSLEIKGDIYKFWYKLTKLIIKRYIARFSLKEVQRWRFETMNEPDLKMYNFLNFSSSDYLDYFRATTNAIHDINTFYASKTKEKSNKNELKIKVGGPAGLFKDKTHHPFCWSVLDYCNQHKCHLDYLSFHKKGDGSARVVVEKDLMMIELFKNFEFTKDVPIANDEADILTNWSLDEEWRADVWYAAMMSKVIIDHFKQIVLKLNVSIEVLSNDNAFLNYHPYYFTQRTLLARFQMNNTKPPHTQFIKKTVYTAMGLLSMLGDEYLPTDQLNPSPNHETNEIIEVLYTKRTTTNVNVVTVLIVAVNDNKTAQNPKNHSLQLDFQKILTNSDNLNDLSTIIATYSLDNEQTNPHDVWKNHKSPDFPDRKLRNLLRANEGPIIEMNQMRRINVIVKTPSIHLVNICVGATLNASPGGITNFRAYYVTQHEILLTWSDEKVQSWCIKTYEVEYRSSENVSFTRINSKDLILLSYQHDESDYFLDSWNVHKNGTIGYRVRAVDYWDRPGPYSKVLEDVDIIHL